MKRLKRLLYALLVSITLISLIIILAVTFSGCKQQTTEITTAAETTGKEVKGELDVYVWEGYLPEAAVKMFEEETGIKINVTFATDNAIMLTLLKGGGTADIVMPTQNQVNRFYEAGLAQPLNLKKIPNYEKVSEALKDQPWAKWNGSSMGAGDIYVIPYVFGTSGIVINTEKYTESIEGIGWEVLFDPDLKGRVSSKNAAESLMLTLDVLGIPREKLLTDTQDTLEKARPKVIELKNNVLKFWDSGAEIIDLLKNEEVWVSHIWDGGGRKMVQFNAKFKYVLPVTGGLGWTDTFMIPKSAVNPEDANMFIDFMLRPDIAAMIISESGYTTTVEGSLDVAAGIDKNLYTLSQEELEKLIWQPNFSEDIIAAYTAFWEEISTVQ